MTVALLLAAVPVAVLGVVLGLRAPVGVLLVAYAAIVPFGSAIDLPIPLPPPFDTLSSVVGALASASMLVHLLLIRNGPPQVPTVSMVWLLFIGVAGVTYAWSIVPSVTAEEFFLLVSGLSLYLLATFLPVTARHRERIALAIVAGATLASLLGVAMFASGRAPVGNSGAPRFLLTGDDPNHTAAGLLLPLVLAASMAGDGSRPLLRRLAFAGSGILVAIGIVLTGSRGGILAAVVALFVLGWQSGSLRRMGVAIATVAVAAVLSLSLAPAALEARLLNSDSTGRTEVWRLGLVACSTYCVQGSGWGTFPDVYQQVFRSDPDAGGYRTQRFRAHNIWLQALVETGFVGFGLLVAGFATAGASLLKLPRAGRAAPLAALIGLAVASSLVSNLTFKYFWLVFLYVAVCATASARPSAAASSPVGTLART